MKFRTELHLEPSKFNIRYEDQLLLLGSCFSENIGAKLVTSKYQTLINPLGIMYHPLPLHQTISDAVDGKSITEEELNINPEGRYTAWNVHSKLCTTDPSETHMNIKAGVHQLSSSLHNANYLILTYGTAYCYHHIAHGAVANCHKFPAKDFEKKLSSPEEIKSSFDSMLSKMMAINPKIKILLTVSPVRHIKDGIAENNRSKAHLLTAVHEICDAIDNCHYLPSYELLIDDLRDYRYFNEDMVHPSNQAIEYIWDKISYHLLDPNERILRSDISKIVQAAMHRPFDPNSEKHKAFVAKQIKSIKSLATTHPNLDFTQELLAFDQ